MAAGRLNNLVPPELQAIFDAQVPPCLEQARHIQRNLLQAVQILYKQNLINDKPKIKFYQVYPNRHRNKIALAKQLRAACLRSINTLADVEQFIAAFNEIKSANKCLDKKGGRLGRRLAVQAEYIHELDTDIGIVKEDFRKYISYMQSIYFSIICNSQQKLEAYYLESDFKDDYFDCEVARVTGVLIKHVESIASAEVKPNIPHIIKGLMASINHNLDKIMEDKHVTDREVVLKENIAEGKAMLRAYHKQNLSLIFPRNPTKLNKVKALILEQLMREFIDDLLLEEKRFLVHARISIYKTPRPDAWRHDRELFFKRCYHDGRDNCEDGPAPKDAMKDLNSHFEIELKNIMRAEGVANKHHGHAAAKKTLVNLQHYQDYLGVRLFTTTLGAITRELLESTRVVKLDEVKRSLYEELEIYTKKLCAKGDVMESEFRHSFATHLGRMLQQFYTKMEFALYTADALFFNEKDKIATIQAGLKQYIDDQEGVIDLAQFYLDRLDVEMPVPSVAKSGMFAMGNNHNPKQKEIVLGLSL